MSNKIRLAFFIVLFVVLWNWIGWPYKVRFECSPLNYFVSSTLSFALPILALATSFTIRQRLARPTAIVLSGLLIIPFGMYGLLAIMVGYDVIERGKDFSYEYLKEAETENGIYRLYRTSCGATCEFGLDLRKEIETPIGIKFVKSVWSQYRADDAYLVSKGGKVTILFNGNFMAEVE